MKGSQIKALRKLTRKEGEFSHLIISDEHVYATNSFSMARVPIESEFDGLAQIPNCISDMCAASDSVFFSEKGVYLFDKKANEKFFVEYEKCERNLSRIFDSYANREFDASAFPCNADLLAKVVQVAKTFNEEITVKFSSANSSPVAYIEVLEKGGEPIIAEFIVMGCLR